MYPILIRLGSFELRTYGVIVALSFLLGLWLSVRSPDSSRTTGASLGMRACAT